MSAERIIRNAIVCDSCHTEIESYHRHDLRWCECGKVAVDGGKDYRRRINNGGSYTEASDVVAISA